MGGCKREETGAAGERRSKELEGDEGAPMSPGPLRRVESRGLGSLKEEKGWCFGEKKVNKGRGKGMGVQTPGTVRGSGDGGIEGEEGAEERTCKGRGWIEDESRDTECLPGGVGGETGQVGWGWVEDLGNIPERGGSGTTQVKGGFRDSWGKG